MSFGGITNRPEAMASAASAYINLQAKDKSLTAEDLCNK
jgi:hypothetical protein